MNKVISIITPTFNSEKALEKCLLSVKKQTYQNIEHIVVDGLSTDGTVEILKRYEGTYNLKWISEKDSGVADAMNKGFNLATGEVFTWIDSDNYYLEGTFIAEVMAAYNNDQDVNMVLTNCLSQYETSEKRTLVNPQKVTYAKLLAEGSMFTPECVYFSKDLFFNAGGFNLKNKLLADYELWLNIFKQNPKYVKLPILSTVYVSNEDSLLHRKPILAYKEMLRIGKEYHRERLPQIIIWINYYIFLTKYPFLKFIKRHKILKDFFVKYFR
ncbi:MAG: glycosyltransferase family 2 protein [Candidatus Paceibacterota bacterium]